MGNTRQAYLIFARKPHEKGAFGSRRQTWKRNIKINLEEIRCNDRVDKTASVKVHWWESTVKAMKFQVI